LSNFALISSRLLSTRRRPSPSIPSTPCPRCACFLALAARFSCPGPRHPRPDQTQTIFRLCVRHDHLLPKITIRTTSALQSSIAALAPIPPLINLRSHSLDSGSDKRASLVDCEPRATILAGDSDLSRCQVVRAATRASARIVAERRAVDEQGLLYPTRCQENGAAS
jgi:hypothetical protein